MGDWEFCHERTGESFPGTRRAESWVEVMAAGAVERCLPDEVKRCRLSGSLGEAEGGLGRARETCSIGMADNMTVG